jgi:Domain of unknown function (DUF4386)
VRVEAVDLVDDGHGREGGVVGAGEQVPRRRELAPLRYPAGQGVEALVPAHRQDAYHRFQLLHTWLGTVVGETLGYALTAVFTVLVVRAVTRASAPRWMAYLGYAAAALIATGVVVPLGLDIARLTNFAGYVSWCAWLVAMAIVLGRNKPHADGTPSPTATTRHRNPAHS